MLRRSALHQFPSLINVAKLIFQAFTRTAPCWAFTSAGLTQSGNGGGQSIRREGVAVTVNGWSLRQLNLVINPLLLVASSGPEAYARARGARDARVDLHASIRTLQPLEYSLGRVLAEYFYSSSAMAAEAGGGAGGAGGEASTAGGAPSAPSFSWSTGAAIGVAGSVVTALAIRSMLDPEGGNNARNALLNHGNFRPVTREVHEAVRLREAPPAVLAAQKGRSSPAAPRLRILRGAVPGDMRGAFVRIGPNSAPQRRPPNMHWFDGDGTRARRRWSVCVCARAVADADAAATGVRARVGVRAPAGMAHAVCFFTPEESAGEAGVVVTYANHWLRTHKFKEESRLGRASFPGISAFWGLSGVASIGRFVWDIARRNVRPGPSSAARMDGVSTANTALVYHDRRLMALQEAAGPFVFRVLRDGMLESVGFHSYANQLKFPMTAHPKVCPETGELHFFGYQMMPGKPYMQYAVVSAGGEFLRAFDLGVKHLTMPHDFASACPPPAQRLASLHAHVPNVLPRFRCSHSSVRRHLRHPG